MNYKKYLVTKQVKAYPMTRGDYNTFRGWIIPSDENPEDEGYIVKYSDDYVSWSPKNAFNESYRLCDNLTFGLAIEALKQGKKVARSGWNGNGMFLYHVPEASYPPCTDIARDTFKGNPVPYGAYIAMKTAQNNVVPWLASQTDMLAEDWYIVE